MLFVTFIWGSTYIVIKNCIHDVPVLPFFFYRFLVASLVMGALLLFLRKKPFQSLKKGIALGMLLLAGCLFQTFALVQVSATNAAFIGSLFVFFVPFFNFLI